MIERALFYEAIAVHWVPFALGVAVAVGAIIGAGLAALRVAAE